MSTQSCTMQASEPRLCVALLLCSLTAVVAHSSFLHRAEPYDFDSGARKPNGHFTTDSTNPASWPRQRQVERNRQLASSDRFSANIAKWAVDDTEKDSFLWGSLDSADFKADDSSEYWDDLCNGTNMVNNPLPGDAAVGKLDFMVVTKAWKRDNGSVCADFVGKEYTDALEAFKDCGSACGGLSDLGCNKKSIKLCKLGSLTKKSASSCIYQKPADYVPPSGLPRPPIETKFWSDFCEYRKKGRQLRIMFEGKNCGATAVKKLGKAANPVECADLATKDAACSKVFDFRFGPPAVCRCLMVGKDCSPAVSTGGHVYAPTTA